MLNRLFASGNNVSKSCSICEQQYESIGAKLWFFCYLDSKELPICSLGVVWRQESSKYIVESVRMENLLLISFPYEVDTFSSKNSWECKRIGRYYVYYFSDVPSHCNTFYLRIPIKISERFFSLHFLLFSKITENSKNHGIPLNSILHHKR